MLLILFVYFFIYKISLDTTVFPDKFRPNLKIFDDKKTKEKKRCWKLKLESRLEFRGFWRFCHVWGEILCPAHN